MMKEKFLDQLYVYDFLLDRFIPFHTDTGRMVIIDGITYSWVLFGPYFGTGNTLGHSFSAWAEGEGSVVFGMWDFVLRTSSWRPFSAASAAYINYNHR